MTTTPVSFAAPLGKVSSGIAHRWSLMINLGGPNGRS
jgi:hypothetical protein